MDSHAKRGRVLSVIAGLGLASLLLLPPNVSAKEMADMGAPSAPVNLMVGGSLSNQLTIMWDFGTYDTEAGLGFPDQFVVYRTQGNDMNFSAAAPLIVLSSNNKSYTDMSVQPNTTYHYKVAARLGTKESANSNMIDHTTSQAPFSVDGEALGASKIRLTWNNVTPGAQKYNVYRSTVSGGFEMVGSASDLMYTDTGLMANTYYVYHIKPVTAMGEEYGGLAYVTTLNADRVAAPTMVPTLKGNPVLPSINNLEWNAVQDATYYALYRGIGSDMPVLIATTTKLGYPDMTVRSGNQYTYSVKAMNEFGESAPSNQVVIKTAAPSMPTSFVGKVSDRNQVTLSWTGVVDAQIYNIYRGTDGRGFTIVGWVPAASTSYVDKDLQFDTTYYYYVKAKAGPADGSMGDEGEKSATISLKTLGQYADLPAPMLVGRALSKTSAELTWNEVPGATKYVVRRDYSDQDFVGAGLFPGAGVIVTGTRYVDTQAFPLVRYTYTVSAIDATGRGGLNAQTTVEVGDYDKASVAQTTVTPAITVTVKEIKTPSIIFKLPVLGGDTVVYSAPGKTVRFSYSYKNLTAKAQRVRLVRTLIRPNGTIAETTAATVSPGVGRSFVFNPSVSFGTRVVKGIYKVNVKAYDTLGKNYGKLLDENSFMIQVQ